MEYLFRIKAKSGRPSANFFGHSKKSLKLKHFNFLALFCMSMNTESGGGKSGKCKFWKLRQKLRFQFELTLKLNFAIPNKRKGYTENGLVL